MILPIYYKTTLKEIEQMKSNDLIYVNCENCSNEFSFQKKQYTSDLKHKNTYRTTCSFKCFKKLQTSSKIIITNCKTCNKEIAKHEKEISESKSGNVFCSKSCAAKYNNTITKTKYTNKICINCNKLYKPTRSKDSDNCSQLCLMEYGMKSKKLTAIIKRKGANRFDSIRANARLYTKYFYLPKCALCNYDKHFEVCHVIPIKDFIGDYSVYEINNKDNLIHLCPNCHWEFDHNKIDIEVIRQAQVNSLIK